MATCLAEITARGADVAWLGVWERNPRAIAFYRKWGFAEVGAHTFVVGDDPQRDLVLCRPAGHHGDSTAPA
jgi:RimJ/RimL family protein N-acetyltransferase